ncbi:MAG: GerW family sporulation protein [Oscillospiraceae bacterium]|nr:GerW family sporulation protein [Oscillospiraceae bacterium]MDY4586069.1 GerW family sporulation protein [Oscillospiraceae bacterium]
MEHPIQQLINDAMGKMREIVDSNTVIGTPITTREGTTILPVSKISFGFVSGGTDFANEKQKDLFGGAASSGASITPVGFLVIKGDSVKLIQLAENGRAVDRVLNMVPEVLDKVEGFISKDKKSDKEEKQQPEPKTESTDEQEVISAIEKRQTSQN